MLFFVFQNLTFLREFTEGDLLVIALKWGWAVVWTVNISATYSAHVLKTKSLSHFRSGQGVEMKAQGQRVNPASLLLHNKFLFTCWANSFLLYVSVTQLPKPGLCLDEEWWPMHLDYIAWVSIARLICKWGGWGALTHGTALGKHMELTGRPVRHCQFKPPTMLSLKRTAFRKHEIKWNDQNLFEVTWLECN